MKASKTENQFQTSFQQLKSGLQKKTDISIHSTDILLFYEWLPIKAGNLETCL